MTLPLILLPGMMCDARLFGPQLEALPGPKTVLPINAHDSVAALAKAVLDTAPDQFALAGLSMGGIVAMDVIRQAPDRVARLALMDTNPEAEAPRVAERRAPQIDRVRRDGLSKVMREELMPYYVAEGPQSASILDLCLDMALSEGPEVFARQSVALRDRPDQSDTLRGYARPTLILCGRHDALCPLARHDLMSRLMPHATLTVIEDAGHLPTLEQPQRTNAALQAWLSEAA